MNQVFSYYNEQTDERANACQFALFVVKILSEHWHISAEETYQILQERDLIDGYIIANFEALHTQGDQYIIYDIEQILKEGQEQ